MNDYFIQTTQENKYFCKSTEASKNMNDNQHQMINDIRNFNIPCEHLKKTKAYSKVIGHVAK